MKKILRKFLGKVIPLGQLCSDRITSVTIRSPVFRNLSDVKWTVKPSWDGNNSNTTQQNCCSTEDLKEYFDLRLDIYRGKYKRELDKYLNHKPLAKLS